MATSPLTKLFKEFFDSEKAGGLILVGCTAASILLTNTAAGDAWLHFWHARLDLSFAGIALDHTIEHWVNDGLMAIFFLLVGLEIERELYIGELADLKNALLPVFAAVGGMLIPAGIHFLFNHGTPTQGGFGIPMATDIAFALGVLSLLGNRVPASVKIFLTALAIIDDLGAILVIAFFYTKSLSLTWLALSIGIFLLLLVLNRLKVNKLVFYVIPGIIMWYCMLRSGIHATLSGVLLAFAIPFRKAPSVNPSEILQHALHKPVAYIILPLFALANTGILLASGWTASLSSPNSLGIIAGLILGKPTGILLCCWLAIRTRLCRLPADMQWSHLAGVGVLAGVGFTMSIFIANLAFGQVTTIEFSKIAVLTASLLASILGFALLRLYQIKK
ncbi:Na+/H+ antiporter NhaA [Flavitalea sp. BT771]|uniref:Na+/H+ antiporter NhaA n=1 Tax=Flavitalea sp. BT771 TaxID=3063329 RepID=UPI0026E41F18|nr:Na+/H+ antiporter NhaA [Flavitalea sp. BT771]MDO6434558.1 Na+/H+ antiporter NhaA [Flavitalea sp. BT771]MDV6223458.1 Na+/H+ antiporter NhaA [Flavitalea sp. BT771]